MRNNILVFGLLSLFLFTSCGGNKWNCNKRYCKVPIESKNVELATIKEEGSATY